MESNVAYATMTVSSSAVSDQPKPIEQGVRDAQAALDRIEHHVERLSKMLDPVLSPAEIVAGDVASLAEARSQRSPHADRLIGISLRINFAADSLGVLMDRLEL